MRDKIIEILPAFQDGYIDPGDVADEILKAIPEPFWTGKLDKNGAWIYCGDIVQYHNVSTRTKPEYWNPIYRVSWNSPCFELIHVGGGKPSGDMTFTLRYYPQQLEVIVADVCTKTPLKGDEDVNE